MVRDVIKIETMERLVNEADGTKLGRMMVPFLEAIVAAKARKVVGTSGSTFGIYVERFLHAAYVEEAQSAL